MHQVGFAHKDEQTNTYTPNGIMAHSVNESVVIPLMSACLWSFPTEVARCSGDKYSVYSYQLALKLLACCWTFANGVFTQEVVTICLGIPGGSSAVSMPP